MRSLPLTLLAALIPALAPAQDPLALPIRAQGETIAAGGAIVRIDGNGQSSISRDGGQQFVALPTADPLLYLRFGTFDPLLAEPRLAGVLAAPLGSTLFVVQSKTAIVPEYRGAIEAIGAEVIAYLPAQGYVVRGEKRLRAAIRQMPWVRCVGDFHVAYRLEPELRDRVATLGKGGTQSIECNVVLAKKRDRAALAQRIVQAGGVVTNRNEGSVYLQAKLTTGQLISIAGDNAVLWVDRTTPIDTDMDNVRAIGGADVLEARTGMTGQGVRVEITEGLDNAHPDWGIAPLVRYDGLEAHGHCTAAIIGANGSGNAAARGLMPSAQLIESSVFSWLFNGTSRYSLMADSVNPALPWRAMQQTASWGNTHTFSYTSVSQELDDALFDFDLPTTQSMGNTAAQSARPQAWAKNVIAVGSVSHWNNTLATDDTWTDGSIGPAPDGRFKPDMCGFGDSIFCADLTGTGGYSTSNYFAQFGGTSAATPIVNGYLGLVQQMFTDGLFHNPLPYPATAANRFLNRPHLSTAKALLANTATSRDFTGASHNLARSHQGWGFPDVARLHTNRDKILVIDEYLSLQQGQQQAWAIWVKPGTPELRVTMAFTDPPSAPNAAVCKVNDLDLRVTNVDGSYTWWGNHGLDAGNQSPMGGGKDDRNNVEQVWIKDPIPGVYKVYISAPSVVQDGRVETPQLDVDYALVAQPLGGGFFNREQISIDLMSDTPGDLRVRINNVPQTGWVEGFTFLTFDTWSRQGFGSFFGMQADMLTAQIYRVPALPGDLFHFTNAGPGSYPFQTFTLPPSIVSALSGVKIDAMVTLLGPDGMICAMSDVARVQLK